MLRRYHESLHSAGIAQYTWDDLYHDYRLALIDWLCVPVQDYADGAGKNYWWPKMACLSAAYREWDGVSLLVSA
jgi:hypothetical protein